MKPLTTAAILLWSLMTMANAKEFTVGYFPTTMPRDPVDIDIYLEHVGVGQVIETLVQIDRNGDIAPNLAKSWVIGDQGRIFTFQLHSDIVFSNGKNLDCEDVQYTLNRHMTGNSQSKNYLSNIARMSCRGKHEITIQLKDPQVSFLKILSRDHLGIVPKGWSFNQEAQEPWTGTGAYRFMQTKTGPFFVRNEKFRNALEVKIDRWRIVQTDDAASEAANLPDPDLILHMPAHIKEKVSKLAKMSDIHFQHPLHFAQTSVWWYPLGKNYADRELNRNVLAIMDELVLALNAENKMELATGVVPRGIQGHITKRIPSSDKPVAFKKPQTIKVSVYASDFGPFFGNDTYKRFEEKYNFKFQIIKVTPTGEQPEETRPDLLIASYAGGFSDPDGFIIVLGSILGVKPQDFFKDILPLYQEASKEQDWTKRGELFRKINERLISEHKVIPAWKKDIYIGKSSELVDDLSLFSYSVRLSRFRPR